MNIKKNQLELLKKRLGKKSISFKFRGNSMYPTLKNNYLLTITATKELKEGEIICFINQNEWLKKQIIICHRLILKAKNKYYAKGDNKADPDPPVSRNDILGKVMEAKDNKGKLLAANKLNLKKQSLTKLYVKVYLAVEKILSLGLAKLLLRKIFANIKKNLHRYILRIEYTRYNNHKNK